MKIIEFVIEFALGMVKRAVTLATVGALLLFAMWVFAVLMPENVLTATELFKSFMGS